MAKTCKVFMRYLLLLFLSIPVSAETIRLVAPIISENPTAHVFFHELLKDALSNNGHTPEIIAIEYPQLRIMQNLDNGLISLFWMLESHSRDQKFVPVKQGLTNGLIGKRILFIRKGSQTRFNAVSSLEDFRKLDLVGGMGKGWFDVDVWEANSLKYMEFNGNWRGIYKMLALGRDYDYFSRGINEIVAESKHYTDLEIEKNLVLIYDRDFRFYLSKTGRNAGEAHLDALSQSLQKAKRDGLIDSLVQKYWAKDLDTLGYSNRTKLYLKTPSQ